MFDFLIDNARKAPGRIVLPEGEDPRIIEGGIVAAQDGLANVILIGNPKTIRSKARKLCVEFARQLDELGPQRLDIVDPEQSVHLEEFSQKLFELRRGRIASVEDARAQVTDPLVHAAIMVRTGHAEGSLGGAVYTTADTVRAALQIIGKAEDTKVVSSFFLMGLEKGRAGSPEIVLFSDCALMVEPDAGQLADIALASAKSWRALVDTEPRVAMLSFSTHGSAKHANVSKVCEATELVKSVNSELLVDGELQFDAAFLPAVAASKAPASATAGQANVFIFPNLDAGNIGYKIAQRIGGATAIGPVLQGLSKPANDLSRGCSAKDVRQMIAVTSNQIRLNREIDSES